MGSYARRVVDGELDALMPAVAAISLDGAKGVGKTATAAQRAVSVYRMDAPNDRAVVAADPGAALRRTAPVLIDEWQMLPDTWNAVRRAVDDGAAPGAFLLTGSAAPASAPSLHAGSGRILSLRMRPMTLTERGVTNPTVSLAALLRGGSPVSGACGMRLADYVEEIDRSGFPGLRGLPERARRAQLDSYLTRALSVELAEQGVHLRRPASLRGWLEAYAAAVSTTASFNAIQRGATPGDADPPTKVTTIRYRDWLTQLWLLDPVPVWAPVGLPLGDLGQAPKHQLADPALAARLLRATSSMLLRGEGTVLQPQHGPLVGRLFESLATLCVRVYAQAAEATVSHLRTRRGDHEVDLIVERFDGALVALEVKLGQVPDDRDVRHLNWLADRVGPRLADRVVLTTGPEAYRRSDGVAVVPLGLLGP